MVPGCLALFSDKRDMLACSRLDIAHILSYVIVSIVSYVILSILSSIIYIHPVFDYCIRPALPLVTI